MNTDYSVQDFGIREHRLDEKSSCRRCKYNNCANVGRYAKEQNTVYDPINNLMLYGVNSNMAVSGVSDGTCNQINPLMYTQNQVCGFGAAGGNPCVKDAYGITSYSGYNPQTGRPDPLINKPRLEGIENFNTQSGETCGKNNKQVVAIGIIVAIVIFILLINNKK